MLPQFLELRVPLLVGEHFWTPLELPGPVAERHQAQLYLRRLTCDIAREFLDVASERPVERHDKYTKWVLYLLDLELP